MNRELSLRIVVVRPPPGVDWAIQRGRAELVQPAGRTSEAITFEVEVEAARNTRSGTLVIRGPVTQGPPDGRFLYLNSGQRAGQAHSCWDRRAKLPLSGISSEFVQAVSDTPGACLEARIDGTARDGGPACATVSLLGHGWCVTA